MARKTFTYGDTGETVKEVIDDNFSELYGWTENKIIVQGHELTHALLTTNQPPATHPGEYWIVDSSTGYIVLFNVKSAGLYVSDGVTWLLVGININYVVEDDNFYLLDGTDNTKSLRFELGGITTGNSRVMTVPDKDGTIALTSDITGINSGTNTGDNAANSSTMYIGTTEHALNRASALETLTGIQLTSPNINEAVALTSTATKLNYLTSVTGTTGTATGKVVFDTNPVFSTNITTPQITGGTAADSKITYKSTTGAGTAAGIAHQWLGGTNGATVLWTMLNNGYFGGGTVSPTNKAHIYENSTAVGGGLRIEQAGAGDAAIQYTLTSLVNWMSGIDNSDSDKFKISSGNNLGTNTIMTMQSDGKIGIGTVLPLTLMHQAKFSADAVGTYYTFSKSRGTGSTHTIVQDNDIIGGLNFSPSDGTDFGTIAAQIKSSVDDATPGASSIGGDLIFSTSKGVGADDLTVALTIDNKQNSGFGITPTAVIHAKAGTATASTAPLKFTSGTLLTTPEAGVMEFLTDKFYATQTTGATRKEIKLVDQYYAEMYSYENATATVIGTQNVYVAIRNFTAGSLSGFTFVAGLEGAIASVADYNGTVAGTILITDVAHGLLTGDIVTIHGTTDYNGTYSITKVDADTFYVTKAYVATNTGSWAMGSYLLASVGSDGVYKLTFNNSAFAASANTTFKFEMNKGITRLDNIVVSRKFSNTDYGSMGSSGLVTIVAGNRIWMSAENETSATDITVRHSNINFIRC